MPQYEVRIAQNSEIKPVMNLLVKERSRFPSFARLMNSPWRRILYQKWVTPRYLRTSANTFVMLQDGELAGYAVAEQSGDAFHLADFVVTDGYDRRALLAILFRKVEQLAIDRSYRYLRASPWEADDETMATFDEAGFHLLDYYLWAFGGVITGVEPPAAVNLRPLNNKEHGELRTKFLVMELDASDNPGREVIDAIFLRRRLPPFKAYAIELTGPEGDTVDIGYLSPRPNERDDGVLSLVISLDPAYWGSELETQTMGGFLSEVGQGNPQPARILVSTNAHADRIEEAMAGYDLVREMDMRPVLYKILAPANPPAE
ncbi:MAG TPA: hypothetical protein P5148_07870 [Anaerolineae bacterium]|nr:hypothetical protein [Anaerolineae bacterium]